MVKRRKPLRRGAPAKRRQNIMYFVILILLLLFFATIGFRFVINTSIWLSGISSDQVSENFNEDDVDRSFLVAPELYDVPDATNSARIRVDGRGTKDTQLTIYVNDEVAERVDMDDEDEFEAYLSLESGKNEILLETEDEDKKRSKDSEIYTVYVITEKPELNIGTPSDGDVVDSPDIAVIGDVSEGASVRINNSPVVVSSDGSFRKELRLREGENKIVVRALDIADNETSVELTVRFENE